MTLEQILFYFFGFWVVGSALMMVFARNTVKAALYLVLCFFSLAATWMLLEAEFLAIALVLVYVGAVMVLFLFVIRMLNVDNATKDAKFTRYLPVGLFVGIIVMVEMTLVVGAQQFGLQTNPAPQSVGADYSNVTNLALELYTKFVYQFELAAILLLIAIIAAIALVKQDAKWRKAQNIGKQIAVNAKDRMYLAKINTGDK